MVSPHRKVRIWITDPQYKVLDHFIVWHWKVEAEENEDSESIGSHGSESLLLDRIRRHVAIPALPKRGAARLSVLRRAYGGRGAEVQLDSFAGGILVVDQVRETASEMQVPSSAAGLIALAVRGIVSLSLSRRT
jgi:hypothetical protein